MISHLNKKNEPKIVDISKKNITNREAVAEGCINFTKSTFKKIQNLKTKKGKIKDLAIVSGILGGKKTSDLIPLCHNIQIESIDIKVVSIKKKSSIKVSSKVKTRSNTGVEMEALTSVSLACLTIYDMCKSIDKDINISNIRLISKKGGKSDFSKK